MAETYAKEQKAGEPDVQPVTCQQRYERLKTEREPYLRRAREAAELTIPSLMPAEGHSGATELPEPFQSAGAEGVNSLASKMLLATLPPGSSFFRLQMDAMQRDELAKQSEGSGKDIIGEVETALGKVERAILDRIEEVGLRVPAFDAFKHALVCGNVLVQILARGAVRLHYLSNYVVKRDPTGNVLEIIAHEKIAKTALPPEAQALIEEEETDEDKKHDAVSVYTRIHRVDDQYKVYQEICGKIVPGSEGSYPLDKSDWVPLRWTRIDGQDYGRGRVEEYIGDFRSLESLSQSIVEGAAMAAKVLFLMNEAGVTSKKAVQDAPNGALIDGDIRDIGILKLDKYADFQVAAAKAVQLEERLNKAFLVHQQRQAERVTAEEVRAVVEELEKALGGVYALLAVEFQLPVVKQIMHKMTKENAIPALPKDIVSPKIITGLDALGRGADFQKLKAFVQDLAETFGPAAVEEWIDFGAYAGRKGAALQIDLEGLVRSAETVQANRQQKMQAEMISKLGPAAMKSESDQMKTQAAATQSAPNQ
jgi:hypothetical protein